MINNKINYGEGDLFIRNMKNGFERFFEENGHYPISVEIDSCKYLPSSRFIQRRFGGVSKLREALGLEITDYTKGKYRSERAAMSIQKSEDTQNEIYRILVNRFGKMCVHREEPYSENSRQRTDFEVHHKGGHFYIDAFHPGTKLSFMTCLNFKIRKYDNPSFWGKIIFLNTNNDVDCDVSSKKIGLKRKQQVMNVNQLKEFIDTLKPIEIKK